MVASTHWLASAAGMAVLEQGGNAFDAAVAAGLHAAGRRAAPERPGRRPAGAALAAPATSRRAVRAGPAPRAATDRALPRRARPRARARHGPARRGRARCVRRLARAAARLRHAAARATCCASRSATPSDGYPLLPQIAAAIRNVEDAVPRRLVDVRSRLPAGRRGRAAAPQPARSRRRTGAILDDAEARRPDRGARSTSGTAASSPRRSSRFQAERVAGQLGRAHGGLLAEADLRDWRPAYEQPLSRRLRRADRAEGGAVEPGARVPAAAAPARGLRPRGDGSRDRRLRAHGHRVREARVRRPRGLVRRPRVRRRADRAAPLARRTRTSGARSSATRRRRSCGRARRRAASRVCPRPVVAVRRSAPGVGEPTRGDTVHLDVVDRFGNIVAATPSGGWLWGAPVIPELGFCLGTRAQMFWLEEGLPNSLEPGKRPRTTLSPDARRARRRARTSRSARPAATSRTSGRCTSSSRTSTSGWTCRPRSTRRITTPRRSRARSIRARRAPRHVAVEERAGRRRLDGLRARGHDVEVSPPWSLGRRQRGRPRAGRTVEGSREPARDAGVCRRPLGRLRCVASEWALAELRPGQSGLAQPPCSFLSGSGRSGASGAWRGGLRPRTLARSPPATRGCRRPRPCGVRCLYCVVHFRQAGRLVVGWRPGHHTLPFGGSVPCRTTMGRSSWPSGRPRRGRSPSHSAHGAQELEPGGDGVFTCRFRGGDGDLYLLAVEDGTLRPTRARAPSRTASAARRASSTRARSAGPTTAGAARARRPRALRAPRRHVLGGGNVRRCPPAAARAARLGVTAIELMPVAAFPGERGWGYDGVYTYAPHSAYGGPAGLAGSSMRRTPRGWVSCSTSSTTTSGRAATPSARSLRTSRRARDVLGRCDRLRAARRARVGDPERRAVGRGLPRRRSPPRRGRTRSSTICRSMSAPSSQHACATSTRARS